MKPPLEALVALGVALAFAAPGCGGGDPRDTDAIAADATAADADSGLAADQALRISFAPLLAVTLERSCPPPGILACGPALRIAARLPAGSEAAVERGIGAVARAGLRAAGYRRLELLPTPAGEADGRIVSEQEVLARWRVAGGILELTTHGLPLTAGEPAGLAGSGDDLSPAPLPRVEVNRSTLSALLAAGSN